MVAPPVVEGEHLEVTWREELRRITIDGQEFVGASFRGIPFFVEDQSKSGGRRLQVHEFPFRDDPVIEDLGGRAKRHRIEGFLVGDNYLAQRDALIAALEEPGAGILVHPEYADDLRVRAAGYTAQGNRKTAAIARISLEFIESPLDVLVLALEDSPDLQGQAVAAAQATDVASESQLTESLQIEGIPSYARESQADDIKAVAATLGETLGALELVDQERAALQVAVAEIVNDALSLVSRPEDMLNAFRSTLETVPTLIAAVPRAVVAALAFTHDTPAQEPALGDTPIRDAERANQAEVAGALRRWTITEASELAASIEYVTEGDALNDRALILERIDIQLGIAGDTVFPLLQELRAAIALAIPGNQELARVIEIQRPVALPALLLSYQLYGSTDQENGILERNGFQHPGFLSGTITVLSEAV
jgi:prophage DNA circulation protein